MPIGGSLEQFCKSMSNYREKNSKGPVWLERTHVHGKTHIYSGSENSTQISRSESHKEVSRLVTGPQQCRPTSALPGGARVFTKNWRLRCRSSVVPGRSACTGLSSSTSTCLSATPTMSGRYTTRSGLPVPTHWQQSNPAKCYWKDPV